MHKLGGAAWKRTKSKVSAAVKDIADDLIKLYAERESEKGHAFAEDDDMQRSFENAFPYEETEDQLRSIKEVKAGYGKSTPDGSAALWRRWLWKNRSCNSRGI